MRTASKLRRYRLVIKDPPTTGWLWDRANDHYLDVSSVDCEWVMTGKGETKLKEYIESKYYHLDCMTYKQNQVYYRDIKGRVYKPQHAHNPSGVK